MAISSRRGAPSLRETIHAYLAEQLGKQVHLDSSTRELLARLADSADAAKAFKRLSEYHRDVPGISAVHGANVLIWCIQAEQVFRRFQQEITKAEGTLVRAKQLDEALANLRKFVAVHDRPPRPPCGLSAAQRRKFDAEVKELIKERILFWPPFRHLSPADIAAMRHGLDLIADRIDECRRYAKDTASRLGATRKMHMKEAAEIATIFFLALNVQHTTGIKDKPHYEEVADLAQAILGPKAEVSVNRVRAVVRKRSPLFFDRIRRRQR
jgi:hypothetical protein